MTALTKDAVIRVIGNIDDAEAIEIVRTGASEAELHEAYAWLQSDEGLVNEFRPLPKGRVRQLVEILETIEMAPDDRD